MLTAKFSVPRPQPTDIRRARLLAALRVTGTPVVLISAPAGWGKTRLAGQLAADLAADGDAVIWLTADVFDDDTELWPCLFAAGRQAIPGFDAPPADAAGGASADRSTAGADRGGPAVDRWLDAVDRLARPVTLVVDDLQQITDRAALAGLARMIALAPPALRVVFAARHDPALPIARWRMEGLVTELRAADLATGADEAADLLAALGVRLEADDLALLVDRTEGWIGGIRLAGQLLTSALDRSATIRALTGGSGAGSLARYLMEQVVEDLDPPDRTFLRDISVLTTVPVDLAGTLTGRSDALAVLRRLVVQTGFVAPVDDAERSFRCHHLLSAALRYDLEANGTDRMRELLGTASRWYADRDRPVDAVRCALRAENWPLAREQLEPASARLIVQGRSATVLQLLAAFPRSVVLIDPELAGVELAARMWTGDKTDHELLLSAVRGGLPGLRRRDPARADVLAYKLAMAAAALARIDGAFGRMLTETTLAAESLESQAGPDLSARRLVLTSNAGTAAFWLGDVTAAADQLTQVIGSGGAPSLPRLNCLSLVGWVDLVQGRLTAAAEAADLAIATAERYGWTTAYQLAPAFVGRAMVGVERFDLAAADADLDRAAAAWEPIRELAVGLTMGLVRARMLTARGRPGEAVAVLAALRADHRTRPTTGFLDRLVRWCEIEAAAAGGDWCAVDRLAPDLSSNGVAEAVFTARRAVLHGDHRLAHRLLTDPDHRPGLGRQLGLQTRRQLWLARTLQTAGRHTQAIATLREALDIARTEGYRLPFVELGGHARPLLRMLLTGESGRRADLAADILALLPTDSPPSSAPTLRRPDFTPREQDLITVLPTRMSNEAIARLLNVSPNTIKTHLRSVYRKLGVDDRDAAVEQAGRLGLL